jgi:hypothetical protein
MFLIRSIHRRLAGQSQRQGSRELGWRVLVRAGAWLWSLATPELRSRPSRRPEATTTSRLDLIVYHYPFLASNILGEVCAACLCTRRLDTPPRSYLFISPGPRWGSRRQQVLLVSSIRLLALS